MVWKWGKAYVKVIQITWKAGYFAENITHEDWRVKRLICAFKCRFHELQMYLKSAAKRVIHITSFRCSFRRVNFNGLDLDINIPFVPDFSVWGPLIYHQYHHLGKRSQVLEFDTIPFSKSTKELFVKMPHWLTSSIFWGLLILEAFLAFQN